MFRLKRKNPLIMRKHLTFLCLLSFIIFSFGDGIKTRAGDTENNTLSEKKNIADSRPETIHVYLQGGQSNAVGYAQEFTSFNPLIFALPKELQKPQEDVLYYYSSTNSKVVGHKQASLDEWINLEPVFNERGHTFGPEITFGDEIAAYHNSSTGSPNTAILKFAIGGTNLHTDWKADGTSGSEGDGPVYQSFQKAIDAGLAALAEKYPNHIISIAGMIWLQGESDAGKKDYEDNLTRFIKDIRATYKSDLAFVIGGIAGSGGGYDLVRKQQAAVASADNRTAYVSSDAWHSNAKFLNAAPDNIHYNHEGQQAIGSAMATAMKDMVDAVAAADVIIISPSKNDTIPLNSDVTISAQITGENASANSVSFYEEGTLIGTANSAPYTITWNSGSNIGSKKLIAQATISEGGKTINASDTITVVVASPQVTISSPMNGTTLPTNSKNTISATVSGVGSGAICNSVKFYVNDQLIETDNSSPYAAIWNTGTSTSSVEIKVEATFTVGGSEYKASDMITISLKNDITITSTVAESSDDAEEKSDLGNVSLTSSDLELINEDNVDQIVGIRFTNITVPQNAIITSAYIQFECDEEGADPTSLQIYGQSDINPGTFIKDRHNISQRKKTSSSVSWEPPAWNKRGEAGIDQRTPDLSDIIREVISQNGWESGNSLVFIITGSGRRTAEAFDGSGGPTLTINYKMDGTSIIDSSPLAKTKSTINVLSFTKNQLTLSNPSQQNLNLSIFNLTGRKLFSQRNNTGENIQINFAETSLSSGAYILSVSNTENQYIFNKLFTIK